VGGRVPASCVCRVGDGIGNPLAWDTCSRRKLVRNAKTIIGAGPYDDFIFRPDGPLTWEQRWPLFNMNGEVVASIPPFVRERSGSAASPFPITSTKDLLVTAARERWVEMRGWLGVQVQGI